MSWRRLLARRRVPATPPLIKESFTRIFVAPDAFKPTIRSYLAATGGRCSMYFPFPERGLELAAVSSPAASFLIIAGSEAALERFRETRVTFHVGDLDAALAAARAAGAQLLQDRTVVPTGVQARMRLPDGLVVEYVEHNEAARRFYTCAPLGLE
jgi:catechol 2,3-dioxygenase-like lactoylglutathione lyase family enzyme